MNEQDKEYLDQLLSLTGTSEWKALCEELGKEIYQHQSNLLENAQNWDQVVFTKGWCAALAYIINTRDLTKQVLENNQEESRHANL